MKLKDVDVVPGTVLDDNDPKKLGRVKIGATGYFDRTVMAIEAIPWVYPFTMSSAQSFTHVPTGSKVWLIVNTANEEEYWYLPFHEMNTDTEEVLSDDDMSSDVIFSRNICGKKLQIYQNKGEGIVVKNGDSSITIGNDGSLITTNGDAVFKIEGSNCYTGAGDAWHKMVKGDKLYDILSQLAKDLSILSTASNSTTPMPLIEPFNTASKNIENALPELLSERSYVSD